jgi:uncharacterized protein (UPF0332 family)
MKAYVRDLRDRARKAVLVARGVLPLDPDTAASRAYYAAFYAVSAHFAELEQTFTKHSAVEAAVHRDLVKTGIWPVSLGQSFSRLVQLRARGDYGGGRHVSPFEAIEAVEAAEAIIRAIPETAPEDP